VHGGAELTQIRVAYPGDEAAIVRVHREAFGRVEEAEIARRLHARGDTCVSLAAQDGDEIIGHVFFSPVSVDGRTFARSPMGLGPVGVLPDHQRSGAGIALCRAGIDACRARGTPFLVVLGHPTYYPRFGFVPAMRFGLSFGLMPPRDAFMAMELVPGALTGVTGPVRYGPEFG
jgi:putative acetyltransferase